MQIGSKNYVYGVSKSRLYLIWLKMILRHLKIGQESSITAFKFDPLSYKHLHGFPDTNEVKSTPTQSLVNNKLLYTYFKLTKHFMETSKNPVIISDCRSRREENRVPLY